MVLQLMGCVSAHQTFERRASQLGLERVEMVGLGFSHALYRRPRDEPAAGKLLHVYLTGDGTPYLRPGLIAADPTPRRPVTPGLLALDPASALILGRPCYHGYADSPGCSAHLWTDGRYSEAVVASMAAALAQAVPPEQSLVLIGFSGGGALAILLARRVPGVVGVVTLGANLDIDAWADIHGYTRLHGSLNPVEGPSLRDETIQLHYAGAKDVQVPPRLSQEAVYRTGGELILLPGTSHYQGWDRHWSAALAELNRRLER